MNDPERLYEQYEDALFALLMDNVAKANADMLTQQNEALLADPDAAVPTQLSQRCLRSIERSCRAARLRNTAKRTLRFANRAAIWILVPMLLLVGVFAASESLRVKTLNYLMRELDVGTVYSLSPAAADASVPSAEERTAKILRAVPADFVLTGSEESQSSAAYHFQNGRQESFEVCIWQISGSSTASVTIDTQDAQTREACVSGQNVSIVQKNDVFQIFWIDEISGTMYLVSGEAIAFDILQDVAQALIQS